MKRILFLRRFNYLDMVLHISAGAVAGNGYLFSAIGVAVIGHIVVSAIVAMYD